MLVAKAPLVTGIGLVMTNQQEDTRLGVPTQSPLPGHHYLFQYPLKVFLPPGKGGVICIMHGTQNQGVCTRCLLPRVSSSPQLLAIDPLNIESQTCSTDPRS